MIGAPIRSYGVWTGATCAALAVSLSAAAEGLPAYNLERTCTYATLQANGGDPDVMRRNCIESERAARDRAEPLWRLASEAERTRAASAVAGIAAYAPGGSYRILERALRRRPDNPGGEPTKRP